VEVANAVAFFVSDDAWWITGQDLVVDGGYSLLNFWTGLRTPGMPPSRASAGSSAIEA